MRTDGSLGNCVNFDSCGKLANYSNTLECKNCLRKRKRRGEPPVVIEGHSKRRLASYAPHKDGRASNPAKALMAQGREAFLEDTHYLQEIITEMARAKDDIENAMREFGFSFEEAIEYHIADKRERDNMRRKARR